MISGIITTILEDLDNQFVNLVNYNNYNYYKANQNENEIEFILLTPGIKYDTLSIEYDNDLAKIIIKYDDIFEQKHSKKIDLSYLKVRDLKENDFKIEYNDGVLKIKVNLKDYKKVIKIK